MSLPVAILYASLTTGISAPIADHQLLRAVPDEGGPALIRRLSGDDLRLYSGVGALTCRDEGRQRTVTAFLVGAFDVVVTVAHAFEDSAGVIAASDCAFVNTDADGRVVERIPVAEFRSKWTDEPWTRGSPRQDIAVARLARTSDYAQRTLPFTKFDGHPREVTVVAYENGHGGEWIKGKSHARAHEIPLPDASGVVPKVVWVDQSLPPTASGAPVLDATSGVVIGVNQGIDGTGVPNGNLLVIDEWLTRTILTFTK
jgi:Trypsin-like peptidase domain